jgi:hypothetical protein
MALLSTASENTAIAAVFVPSTTYYLSLHSATPGQTGTSEISGGSYARQGITFGSASGGSEASTNSQTFTNLPAESGGIGYFGIWSAATAGTYIGGGTTTGLTGSLPSGISVNFATGAVTVAIS